MCSVDAVLSEAVEHFLAQSTCSVFKGTGLIAYFTESQSQVILLYFGICCFPVFFYFYFLMFSPGQLSCNKYNSTYLAWKVPLCALLSVFAEHQRSPGDYTAVLCHSASLQRAKVCVSNIEPRGLGSHAVGTIPMTRQLGMLSCCSPSDTKESC